MREKDGANGRVFFVFCSSLFEMFADHFAALADEFDVTKDSTHFHEVHNASLSHRAQKVLQSNPNSNPNSISSLSLIS